MIDVKALMIIYFSRILKVDWNYPVKYFIASNVFYSADYNRKTSSVENSIGIPYRHVTGYTLHKVITGQYSSIVILYEQDM